MSAPPMVGIVKRNSDGWLEGIQRMCRTLNGDDAKESKRGWERTAGQDKTEED